jgi:hypothetical protein
MPMMIPSKRLRSIDSDEEEGLGHGPVGKVSQNLHYLPYVVLTPLSPETMLATSPHITYLLASKILETKTSDDRASNNSPNTDSS